MQQILLGLGAASSYKVDRSLRINSSDSAYLRKSDFGSPDSSTTFTFSAWIKRTTVDAWSIICLLYTSPSPRDLSTSRMPSSA